MNGVLFVVDPLAGLHADVDASIGLMAATQDLGVPVWGCRPEDLSVVDGRVLACAQRLLLAARHRGGDRRPDLGAPVDWRSPPRERPHTAS